MDERDIRFKLFDLLIGNGTEKEIVDILDSGIDVNYICQIFDGYELTPLSSAIFRGHKNIVNLLLKYGANPDFCGSHTPIELVVTHDQPEIFNLLVKNGMDIKKEIKVKCWGGKYVTYSPLEYVTNLESNKFIRILLQHDHNLTLHEKTSAYMLSLKKDRIDNDIFDLLCPLDFPIEHINEAFLLAAENGKHREMQKLLNKGTNIDIETLWASGAMKRAIHRKYLNVIKLLIYLANHITRSPSFFDRPISSLSGFQLLTNGGIVMETCSIKNDVHNYFNILPFDIFDQIVDYILNNSSNIQYYNYI